MHLHWMLMKESPFILISSTEKGAGRSTFFFGTHRLLQTHQKRLFEARNPRMESLQKKGITLGNRNRIKPLSMQMSVCCQPQSFGFRIGIRSSMFILTHHSMPLDVCWRKKGRLITPSTFKVYDFPLGNYTTTEPSLSWFDPYLRPKIEHHRCL